jgi:phage virion morphogenesis protein
MANGLSFTVDSAAIMAALARTVRVLDNPQALLADIGFELEGNIRQRFDVNVKTDPSGRPWDPLAESTKKSYNKKYEGVVPGSLLNRSGDMLKSLTSNTDANSVEVGFSILYAIFHVTGTRHMPRRDSLFAAIAANGSTGTLGAQDEADIIEIVEDHLRQALGDAA